MAERICARGLPLCCSAGADLGDDRADEERLDDGRLGIRNLAERNIIAPML
jgi:hypothetical protein